MNEQDKKRVEEIVNALNTPAGGRRNGKTWYLTTSIGHLLDIIARQDAEIDRLKSIENWNACESEMVERTLQENKELLADSDRLAAECKAKDAHIEALERAMLYCILNDCVPCHTCFNIGGEDCIKCSSKEHGCLEFYQFDEARFRKGGGGSA